MGVAVTKITTGLGGGCGVMVGVAVGVGVAEGLGEGAVVGDGSDEGDVSGEPSQAARNAAAKHVSRTHRRAGRGMNPKPALLQFRSGCGTLIGPHPSHQSCSGSVTASALEALQVGP